MPTTTSLFTWLVIALFAIDVTSTSLAAPVLDSSGTATIKEQDTSAKQADGPKPLTLVPAPVGSTKVSRSNGAEKLKRGLTNFINQLNPAPFFVPTQPANDSKLTAKTEVSGVSQSSAEPVAIVNEDPTADVLIKRPNRLGQTRQIGGPLRWG